MDFTNVQMAFIVVVMLAAAAVIVFLDLRRKRRQRASRRRFKPHTHSVTRPERPIMLFETAPIDYTFAKNLAGERPLEPLVGTVTRFRPPVQLRPRETVTVEMLSHAPAVRPPSAALLLAGDTQAVTLPAVTIDAALWERLVSSQPERNLLSSPDGVSKFIHETPAPPTLGSTNTVEASYRMILDDGLDVASSGQPSGMIRQPVLDELLESGRPFTGLVVSISINDSDSSMWHSQGLMQSVGAHIASLLKENDFSCRTSYDEFVIVCRGEQGARAQRRLNRISERLWDYQLRGLGACTVLFSWGAVEAQDQPLAEAIASAAERMRETKRSGNAAKSALAHRQAV
jgi:hypothetical protein